MLKLKVLHFKNIGRFVEEQTIDFTNLNFLIQIDAQNNNTGGSSGSGKSTIFNALDWLLGLSDISTTVLQSRLTDKHITVEGQFDWDGKEVKIHRSKKLSITINGEETTGSSKLTEELLDQILGLDRTLFSHLLHRKQGEQGFFLSLTPAKMNEFLADCLGVTHINSKIDLIDQKIKGLDQSKIQSQSDLQASKASLQATQDALASLGTEPASDITEESSKMYKQQYENWKDLLNKKTVLHKEEKEALEAKKPKLSTIPFDKTSLSEIEKEIKNIESQISSELDKERTRQSEVNRTISSVKLDINNKISDLKLRHNSQIAESKTALFNLTNIVNTGNKAKETAIQLAKQIKSLRDGTCHTCLQPWQTEQTKTEEERLLGQLNECKVDIEASVFASKEIETIKTALVTINDQVNAETMILNEELKTKLEGLVELLKPQTTAELVELNVKLSDVCGLKLKEIEKEKAHNSEQNIQNQKLLESFLLEQKTLFDKHTNEIKDIREEMEYGKSEYERRENEFKAHIEALARYRNTFTVLKAKEADMNSKIVHMNQNLVHLTEELEIAEEAKRCLKSYLSCSFDDSLESISDTSTRILRAVPTMANATIRLEGTKESTSGSIKNQVNACLDSDGEMSIPIKSLSGGERSAVDLAVDLAVSEFIAERSKAGINLLCLDEIMNGFDTFGKECAIEMIKTLGSDRHVLIIEHDPIAKELINERITVIRDGETSYIK